VMISAGEGGMLQAGPHLLEHFLPHAKGPIPYEVAPARR
jgi:hypothetical protein